MRVHRYVGCLVGCSVGCLVGCSVGCRLATAFTTGSAMALAAGSWVVIAAYAASGTTTRMVATVTLRLIIAPHVDDMRTRSTSVPLSQEELKLGRHWAEWSDR